MIDLLDVLTVMPPFAVATVATVATANVSVTIVFTPAAAVAGVSSSPEVDASVAIVFTATAAGPRVLSDREATVRVVFRVRANVTAPEVVVGDHYLGRYQEGQEVPLWVMVVDARGRPLDPTTVPPTATIYDLGTGLRAGAVALPKLRGSRVSAVYEGRLRLGDDYPPGRYGALVRASTGAFTGQTLLIFEVMAGGDARGPVPAAYAAETPVGWRFLAQVGSGALIEGRRPRILP